MLDWLEQCGRQKEGHFHRIYHGVASAEFITASHEEICTNYSSPKSHVVFHVVFHEIFLIEKVATMTAGHSEYSLLHNVYYWYKTKMEWYPSLRIYSFNSIKVLKHHPKHRIQTIFKFHNTTSHNNTTSPLWSRCIWIILFIHSSPNRWHHIILCSFSILYQTTSSLELYHIIVI